MDKMYAQSTGYAQNVMQSTALNQPHQPELLRLMDRIQQSITMASELAGTLEATADRLCGSVPSGAGEARGPQPVPNGHINALDDALLGLESQHHRINEAMKRLGSAI